MKLIPISVAAIFLCVACATPNFPEGQPSSPFDGLWSGDLHSPDKYCNDVTFEGEVRSGYLIGKVFYLGAPRGEVWGQISPDGSWDGAIGKVGIVGGASTAQFTETAATGNWESSGCAGTIDLRRAS